MLVFWGLENGQGKVLKYEGRKISLVIITRVIFLITNIKKSMTSHTAVGQGW